MDKINKQIMKFFSSLSDETRLKILLSLIEQPKKVNDIHRDIGKNNLTLSAISHQLRQLSDIEIVTYERKGREKIFQLSNNFCWCILQDAFSHFKEGTGCKRCLEYKKRI